MQPYFSNYFLVSFFYLTLLFCSSNASLSAKVSVIPFQLIQKNTCLYLGAVKDSIKINPMAGLQIQPTSNLLLGGLLSPRIIKKDLSMYYQFIIGYFPKNWKLINISSSMIQIGMHRYRFGKVNDSRWFSLSYLETLNLGMLKLNMCWNKLITQQWERNTILISTNLKLLNKVSLQTGAVTYFTPKFAHSPFLVLNIQI